MKITKRSNPQYRTGYSRQIGPDFLKKRYCALSVGRAEEFKRDLCETLNWSPAVWYNKRHGITRVTAAERLVILEKFEYYTTLMDDDYGQL